MLGAFRAAGLRDPMPLGEFHALLNLPPALLGSGSLIGSLKMGTNHWVVLMSW